MHVRLISQPLSGVLASPLLRRSLVPPPTQRRHAARDASSLASTTSSFSSARATRAIARSMKSGSHLSRVVLGSSVLFGAAAVGGRAYGTWGRAARCDAAAVTVRPTAEGSDAVLKAAPSVRGMLAHLVDTLLYLLGKGWNLAAHSLRLLELLVYFSPPLFAAPFLLPFAGQPRHLWRVLLSSSLNRSGPTFQKLGQWASTRPDLFGSETRSDLQVLHDSIPREAWRNTYRTLTEAFYPQTVEEVFSSFNTEPVGAGCIAQVHRAVLREGDVEVAVKVRRYGVVESIRRDVTLLCAVTSWMEYLLPPLRTFSLNEAAENFAHFMTSQLDMKIEGSNLARFNELFERSPDVVFPRAVLAREAVLVETFEPGYSASKLLAMDKHGVEIPIEIKHQMAFAGVRAFLEMVLVHNFTHSDMHPGNILVRTEPPFDPENPLKKVQFDKLVLIDVGLVTELGENDQRNFIELFDAVVDLDGHRAATLMVERSRDPSSVQDMPGFIAGMTKVIDAVKLNSFKLSKVQIGTVLQQVMYLVHRHKVKLESNFTTMVVAIIVLEGVGRQLHPDLDIFISAIPMLAHARKNYQQAAFKGATKVVMKRTLTEIARTAASSAAAAEPAAPVVETARAA